MIHIDCSIEAGGWTHLDILQVQTKTAISAVLEETKMPLPDQAEVSLVFGNDALVQNLNRDWREQDKPTNVLSFAANDGLPPAKWSPLLGDIVFGFETVQREAKEQNKTFDAHLTHLIVHGFLHLLGHDHMDDDEAEIMEMNERKTLSRLGIADPYSDT